MTCSRLRVSVPVLIVVPVAAIAILAMLVSSAILFDRSILRPIPGAYSGAPAGSRRAPAAADSRAAPPSQLQ